MAITFIGTLRQEPKEKLIVFTCAGGNRNKICYARFFINEGTLLPKEGKIGEPYILTCTVTHDKYKITKDKKEILKDDLRCKLILREIKLLKKTPDYKESENGYSEIRGIVRDVVQKTFVEERNRFVKDFLVITRIKLALNENSGTYLWMYSSDDLLPFEKGDKIHCVVSVFNKRAYNEKDFSISEEERHIYNDKARWYTELELISAKVIKDE